MMARLIRWGDRLAMRASCLALFWRRRGGPQPTILGNVWVRGAGTIDFGRDVVLDGRRAPIELHALPGGSIVIGNGARIEAGVSVEAQSRVEIGDHCILRPFSKVLDNHFHPLRGNRHKRPPSRRVVLEEGVVLGERSIVLPGVVVGQGCLVDGGTVVARAVPAKTCVSGNPARYTRLVATG